MREEITANSRQILRVESIFGGPPGLEEARATAAAPAAASPEPEETAPEATWVALRMVDSVGDPVKGMKFKIELPDGATQEGALDGDGLAKIQSTKPGSCKVFFPDLDAGDWERA